MSFLITLRSLYHYHFNSKLMPCPERHIFPSAQIKFTNENVCIKLWRIDIWFCPCAALATQCTHAQLTRHCSHIYHLWQAKVTFTTPYQSICGHRIITQGELKQVDAGTDICCLVTGGGWLRRPGLGMTSPHVTAHTRRWSQTGLLWHHGASPVWPRTKMWHAENLQMSN